MSYVQPTPVFISKLGWGGARANSGGSRPNTGGARPNSGPKPKPKAQPVRILQPRPLGPRWYVLQLQTGREQRALNALKSGEIRQWAPARPPFRVERPMQCVMRWVRGIRTEGEAPMFGSYIFCQFDARVDDWKCLYAIDGVRRVMTNKSLTPLPLPDDGLVERLVDTAATRLHLTYPEMPHRPVRSSVRLSGGGMQGLCGTVLACDGHTTTAAVSIMGRDVPVTMAYAAFENA